LTRTGYKETSNPCFSSFLFCTEQLNDQT
jgi:hypothetical protein